MPVGCATHTYSITHRNGGFVTASGVLTNVEYNRVINDASTATVTIASSGPGCCAELGQIRSWAQNLNIYRTTESGDSQFMWSGPIFNVDWSYDEVVVDATDNGEPSRVNVRVPLQLLRAGVRLAALVPPQALVKANASMLRSSAADRRQSRRTLGMPSASRWVLKVTRLAGLGT